MALRAVLPRDRAAFCRDIATPAARIRYEELQVVARRQGSDGLPPHRLPVTPVRRQEEPIQPRERRCEGSCDPEGTVLAQSNPPPLARSAPLARRRSEERGT